MRAPRPPRAQSQQAPLDVGALSPEQLNQLRKQLEQEVKQLSDNFGQLRLAKSKYDQSGDSLSAMTAENDGKEVMVPLTQSMYVPGNIASCDEVMVDIGTGYFVQKTVEGAKEYMKRRSDFLGERLNELEKVILAKQRDSKMVLSVLQSKIAMMTKDGPTAGAGTLGAAK